MFSMANMWIILTVVLVSLSQFTPIQADYDYEFLELYINSSDTDKFQGNLEVVRISRGVYGIKGTVDLKIPLTEEFTVTVDTYRSTSGTGGWTKLPYTYEKTNVIDFIDHMYRKIAMESMKECSNLPQLKPDWKPPFPAGKYMINECQIKKDNLPSHAPDGFYKIEIMLVGPVNIYTYTLSKIENKF